MTPFAPLEEHVRRNMEMFERTFSMFKPFAAPRTGNAAGTDLDKAAPSRPRKKTTSMISAVR